MQVFMKIMKELGIAVLFLLLILCVLAFTFYDKVPFGKEIPEAVKYTKIEKSSYDVRGDLEDRAGDTQTFQTSASQLEQYLTDKYVSPGRFEPFNTITSVSDIPNETVSISTAAPVQKAQDNTSANTESGTNTTSGSELE